jgi:predicted helicase
MKKAKIFYFTLQDEQTKEEKLDWFADTKFDEIPFDHITPDQKANWVNLTDNDFDSFLPLIDKDVKEGKSDKAVFILFSRGIETTRDEWVYDFDRLKLEGKIEFFLEKYNLSLEKDEYNSQIKWSSSLEEYAKNKIKGNYQENKFTKVTYRPYIKQYFYADRLLSHRLTQNHYAMFSNELNKQNFVIWFKIGSAWDFFALAVDTLSDLLPQSGSQCLPLYRYDKNGNRIDNITDWGLTQFQTDYNDPSITKENIFHYTYSVLHHPAYRKKYELNLKREFPRLPFYDNFFQWVEWGKQLMDLHLNYETIEPYGLTRTDATTNSQPKAKLKADKEKGYIDLDGITFLQDIPAIAWDYKLGNRSALEWILDQYKEKKPKDPTIAKLFNTYRFADYKEHVIDLLQRVCTVSVRTMKIIGQMPDD